MKRFLIIAAIFIALVALAAIYLFLPFTSDEFRITVDQKKLKGKEQFLAEAVPAPAQKQPNIILLFADDLGKTDISVYGHKIVETPNLDTLAAQGVVLTEGYVTAPICSPSRAGLLTGRYQQRFGHELQPVNRYLANRFQHLMVNRLYDLQHLEFASHTKVPDSVAIAQQGLPVPEITLADLLKKNGYETAIIGKWHLGQTEPFQPLQRGFGYHYGFYEAFSWFADTANTDIVNVKHKGVMDSFIWKNGNTGPSTKKRNNTDIVVNEFYTGALAREATQFLDANKDKPFFLYVPFNAPHTPFQALKADVEKYKAKGVSDINKAVYYALITNLDKAIGDIHRKVKQLGLEENTLIVFLSDNGGATYTEATDNASLKGGKMSLYEGGINVPFIVKWKGNLPAGTTYRQPVTSLDIFVTAASVAKANLPADREYDGVNLLPYLNQKDTAVPHPVLYWRSGYNKAIRKGDWKLVLNLKDDITALYNLAADKSETTNLALQQPAKVQELKNDLAEWEKKLVAPLWPGNGFFKNNFDGKIDRFSL